MDPEIQAWFGSLENAILHKQWWMLASLVLIAVVAFIRWFAPKVSGKLGTWLKTDHGAVTLVLVTSLLGGLATAFGSGTRPTLELVVTSLKVALFSALAYPPVRKFVSGWAQAFFGVKDAENATVVEETKTTTTVTTTSESKPIAKLETVSETKQVTDLPTDLDSATPAPKLEPLKDPLDAA